MAMLHFNRTFNRIGNDFEFVSSKKLPEVDLSLFYDGCQVGINRLGVEPPTPTPTTKTGPKPLELANVASDRQLARFVYSQSPLASQRSIFFKVSEKMREEKFENTSENFKIKRLKNFLGFYLDTSSMLLHTIS